MPLFWWIWQREELPFSPRTGAFLRQPAAPPTKITGGLRLRLRDPQQVLRIILFDAVAGNTDRHRANIHYGQREDTDGRYGFLLPLDHGRSLLNSNPAMPGDEPGGGLAVLTGQAPYSNPNQLLPPAADLVNELGVQAVHDSGRTWLSMLERAGMALLGSPGSEFMSAEIRLFTHRCQVVAEGLMDILAGVREVVVQ